MYSAVSLSKYVVTRCVDDGNPITNLQLQKILFFIQKAWLEKYKFPAFSEPIQAWKFGPVVPTVYYMFCGNGAMAIMQRFDGLDSNFQNDKMLNEIIEQKRTLNPWELVNETHAPEGAWAKTFKHGLGNKQTISIRDIQLYG